MLIQIIPSPFSFGCMLSNTFRRKARYSRGSASVPVPTDSLCPQYGGLVTTMSILLSGSLGIRSRQSPRYTSVLPTGISLGTGASSATVFLSCNCSHDLVWPSVLSEPAYISHTTPSPSPSLALGTIAFGNPPPPPLLPCTLSSPVASASSQEPYTGV